MQTHTPERCGGLSRRRVEASSLLVHCAPCLHLTGEEGLPCGVAVFETPPSATRQRRSCFPCLKSERSADVSKAFCGFHQNIFSLRDDRSYRSGRNGDVCHPAATFVILQLPLSSCSMAQQSAVISKLHAIPRERAATDSFSSLRKGKANYRAGTGSTATLRCPAASTLRTAKMTLSLETFSFR